MGKHSPPKETFQPEQFRDRPDPARRYLEHSIAPVLPLAASVQLEMHGEINLNRWMPFQAKQVIRWDKGMIWKAKVKMFGLPVNGYDRIIDGARFL